MSHPLLLLVDDAPEIALLVERLARRAGQEFIYCGDAESAWEYLQKNQATPDLVLLDVHLPGMSGLELLREIKKNEIYPAPKVMMITAYGDQENYIAAKNLGADDFLTKPLDFNQLKDKLKN